MSELFRLDGKVAFITGAASGIGREIARLYARQGAHVWIGDLNEAGAETVAAELCAAGGAARAIRCDVTSAASLTAAVAAAVAADGRLDVWVNNAGISHVGKLLECTEADWERVMAVNARGVFLGCQAAVRQMLAQAPKGGVIVNLASIASVIGLVDRFLYAASKGAVIQMTRCVALDYVRDGIRCNCICPARVHTPFVDDFLARHYPGKEAEMFQKLSAYQPIGRMGQPEEIAALAVYLASDQAAFVTGGAYLIDGGVTAA